MKQILAFVASAMLVIAMTLFSTAGPASACHKGKAHGNQTQSSTLAEADAETDGDPSLNVKVADEECGR